MTWNRQLSENTRCRLSPQPHRALTMLSDSAPRYSGLRGKAANNGRRCRA
jgi:hypothetical protein